MLVFIGIADDLDSNNDEDSGDFIPEQGNRSYKIYKLKLLKIKCS